MTHSGPDPHGAVHRSTLLDWVTLQPKEPVDRGRASLVSPLGSASVALCHEWTLRHAGSEKVASALAELIQPTAVYTLAGIAEVAAEVFPGQQVVTTKVGMRPGVQRRWDRMLPLLHAGWRSLDLSDFDVVVTSSHSCVNAVRVGPQTRLVSYCHTPMRYAWEWRQELERVPRPLRPAWPAVAGGLRRIDRSVAARVDLFVANSRFVADRIQRAYGRPAHVVAPPVATDFYTPPGDDPTGSDRDDYFLVAGRLVDYKRADLAVRAAAMAGVPLVVAGDGPQVARLRSIAGPQCRFVPSPADDDLIHLYRRARALVYPGIEDFGITPVEAMACGTPVLALGRGGVTDSVVDGVSGRFVADQEVEAFAQALRDWPVEWSREACRTVAEGFSQEHFAQAMTALLEA